MCMDCGGTWGAHYLACPVTRSWGLVLGFFGGDVTKTTLWFSTPNPQLGGVTPNAMILIRRTQMLLRVIRDLLAENEPPAA
jgi:hypothetical protein